MAELFADLFVSVDGSAFGTRSPGYFGFYGPDLERWITGERAYPRLDVMGRRTYETLAGLPEEHRDDRWTAMAARPTVVFSRTLTEAAWPGVQLDPGDAVERVRQLRAGHGPDLRTIGSLSVVHQLLGAGLVDHLRLLVFPLVLGETGRQPVFEGLGDFELRLHRQAVLDGRIVLLDYRPGGAPPYAAG